MRQAIASIDRWIRRDRGRKLCRGLSGPGVTSWESVRFATSPGRGDSPGPDQSPAKAAVAFSGKSDRRRVFRSRKEAIDSLREGLGNFPFRASSAKAAGN